MEFMQQGGFELVLGWEFYVPLLFALVLIAFAVPVWAVLGVTSISMLYTHQNYDGCCSSRNACYAVQHLRMLVYTLPLYLYSRARCVEGA